MSGMPAYVKSDEIPYILEIADTTAAQLASKFAAAIEGGKVLSLLADGDDEPAVAVLVNAALVHTVVVREGRVADDEFIGKDDARGVFQMTLADIE